MKLTPNLKENTSLAGPSFLTHLSWIQRATEELKFLPLKEDILYLWHRRKKLGNYSLSPLKLSFCPFNNLKEQIQNIQTDLTNYYPFPFCFNSSCATLLQVFEVKTSDFF